MQKLKRGLGWTLGALIVIALLLRLFVLDVWVMPDDPWLVSGAPALGPGDTVLVLTRGSSGFGSLVRCPDPQKPGTWVVGRIAGVPGDTVEVEGGRLWVNGQRYDSESACAESKILVTHPESLKEVELDCGVVPMGGGWHYRASSSNPLTEQKKTAKVGPGKVFLLSDNRFIHDDSRDFGLLDLASCQERIFFRLWGKAGWSDEKRRFGYVR